MKNLFTFCVLAVLSLAVAPQAVKSAPLCPFGNATLHGTYVVSGSGSIPGLGPAAALGEVTFDGHGNSTATFTASFNGTIKTITVPGTYTVNPDCTGTHVEVTSHYFFVATPDGNKTSWVETDNGTVLSGTIVRLHPLDDETAQSRSGQNHLVPASLRRTSRPSATARR